MPDFTTLLRDHLPDLSVGAVLGFACGYALKKAGRAALLILGLLFIAVQLLAAQGFVHVDWTRVQSAFQPLLEEGGRALGDRVLQVLTTNLPFGASFTAALLLGLRTR
ncbi:FUN14 domain-containing protein [Deinococcus maricopensis]|uniref:FUN14 domain-containing protein n=1 Tax=Deinococcus maricopensis TaxID=309887 RepID=UPI0003043336|nr:FUN14 domain-containing protein [Deinococcus maricopensis]